MVHERGGRGEGSGGESVAVWVRAMCGRGVAGARVREKRARTDMARSCNSPRKREMELFWAMPVEPGPAIPGMAAGTGVT